MTSAIRSLFSRLILVAVFAALALLPAVAWAQKRRTEPEVKAEPSFAFEYGVVIFVILLGLAVVFRPSRRADPEDEIQLPFAPKL